MTRARYALCLKNGFLLLKSLKANAASDCLEQFRQGSVKLIHHTQLPYAVLKTFRCHPNLFTGASF